MLLLSDTVVSALKKATGAEKPSNAIGEHRLIRKIRGEEYEAEFVFDQIEGINMHKDEIPELSLHFEVANEVFEDRDQPARQSALDCTFQRDLEGFIRFWRHAIKGCFELTWRSEFGKVEFGQIYGGAQMLDDGHGGLQIDTALGVFTSPIMSFGDASFEGWVPADAVPPPIAGAHADAGPYDDALHVRIFAPAPAATLTALSAIMREQTELLARVAGARAWASPRRTRATSHESGAGAGITERIAGATAEARAALGDRIRAPPNGGWRTRIAEIDAEDASPLPVPPTRGVVLKGISARLGAAYSSSASRSFSIYVAFLVRFVQCFRSR
ncbi:hypothetical protein FB451DRAFT_1460861 [Mycena latifolia]|nr:hypothetical protein FB451DRAFT_1460861 [Mycena latifolia]